MATAKFETSDAPRIAVTECAGSLKITGHDARLVAIEVDGGEQALTVQREGDAITLSARDDCYITCPASASLALQQVYGKLSVRGVDAPLTIQSALRDISLRDIGAATIQSAAGDLDARHINGDLHVESLAGDARLRRIQGALQMKSCSGDLNARDLLGGADVQNVGGDIFLSSALTSGREYRLRAGGDVKIYLPADCSARCMFEAGGNVRCGLELSESQETAQRVAGRLGAGEASLELRAGGDIAVRSEQAETLEVDAFVEAKLDAKMAELDRRLREELAGLGDLGERIGERVRRKAEQAAERARRQAEKEAERARRQAERQARGFSFTWGGPREPAPPPPPVSDAERLAILRMVEEKKITADEAALLLEALEK